MLGVQGVHAQVAESGAKKVLLGAVLQQRGLERGCRNLFVDLDGPLVLFELGRIFSNLQTKCHGISLNKKSHRD